MRLGDHPAVSMPSVSVYGTGSESGSGSKEGWLGGVPARKTTWESWGLRRASKKARDSAGQTRMRNDAGTREEVLADVYGKLNWDHICSDSKKADSFAR